jgi:catechol-2,3-dioxygenase
MIEGTRWLALEVKDLDRARAFYERLSVPVEAGDGELRLAVDEDTDLVLRRPTAVPRGGLHTHYALSVPAGEYEDWVDRLTDEEPPVEHDFGGMRSLYVYDPDGNCLELAGVDVPGPGVDGLFEVTLEVRALDPAVEFYRDLGFEVVDRGPDRVRLTGPTDLELWTPRLGIAGARAGVHVDLGLATPDPGAALAAVEDRARAVERVEPTRTGTTGDGSGAVGEAIRLRDPDGHTVTLTR